jgi:hypothetical protein
MLLLALASAALLLLAVGMKTTQQGLAQGKKMEGLAQERGGGENEEAGEAGGAGENAASSFQDGCLRPLSLLCLAARSYD